MNLQSYFPVTLSSHWLSPYQYQLSPSLLSWLLDQNSLTARLKAHCQNFRVELLGQHVQACRAEESNDIIVAGEQVLVREVLLYCDDIPQVFARSLLPLTSLTGAEQVLANLGSQSLGQILFNNPSLERQAIEVAEFDANSTVATLVNNLQLNFTDNLWGRRSVFILENKPLMVAEVFLPQAFAYQPLAPRQPTQPIDNENKALENKNAK